tara:strand:+ start:517 stop:735 length:219 start_codon:yes stop_codon:yes gene_type:complete
MKLTKRTPAHINEKAAARNGYFRVEDKNTGSRYLKTPNGWQYWSDIHDGYVNGASKATVTKLDAAFALIELL